MGGRTHDELTTGHAAGADPGVNRVFYAPILGLFLLSGGCGLVYQIVWVREFGNLFGNNVHSASLVTAVFMLGLGVGSYLFGRYADGPAGKSPAALLRTYGYLEIGIGVLAMLLAWLLPQLESLSPHVASYVKGNHGWHYLSWTSEVVRYGAAVALMLPITLLMGGTLTLLIRHRVRADLHAVGWRIGLLYGINTLGAALGAFLVDAALIPAAGLLATQAVCVVTNLAIGLVALRLAAAEEASPSADVADRGAPDDSGHTADPALPADRSAGWLMAATGLALGLSGFAGMGFEIAWYRILAAVLGGHRATFSILLAVILTGIGLGALCGPAIEKRLGRPTLLFAASQVAFVVVTLGILATFRPSWLPVSALWPEWVSAGPAGRWVVQSWSQLRVIGLVVGVPAFLMGFTFPLANAHVQRTVARVGGRAGALYLLNTVGAVTGSLVVGFLLLPTWGVQTTVLAMAIAALLAPVPLLWIGVVTPAERRQRILAVAILAVGGLAAAAWANQPGHAMAQRLFTPITPTEQLLSFREGINETVVVTQEPTTGARRLYTNNYSMSTTRAQAQRYMRAFSHVPLLMSESPKSVAVICFGVGNTSHSASLHPTVQRLDVIDLSENVLEHAQWFQTWNRNVLLDPRVSVFVNDGRQHLRMQAPETYDLVTLEPPPIAFAGVAALYSKEFYQLASDRVKTGGFVTQWLPAYQLPGALDLALVRAFVEVFPDAILLSGNESELILLGKKGGAPLLDPVAVDRRIAATPAVQADLRRIGLHHAVDIAAMFVGSAATLARATEGVLPVTDDLPLMEYGPVGFRDNVIPASLFAVSGLPTWCPACVAPDFQGREALQAQMATLQEKYDGLAFRNSTSGMVTVAPIQVRAR